MVGLGPDWVRLGQNGKVTNSISGEATGDFMFWPTGTDSAGSSNRPTIKALRAATSNPST